ncbi:MAG: tetratricopeptide repeat protein [Flavobacteriales bacterium]|nr:tetratricopeptide repeat protein [Flavobacteriales bacterium]
MNLNAIEGYLGLNEYRKAVKTLDKWIKENPNDVPALLKRADINIVLRNKKEAREDLERAMFIDENSSKAYLVYARLMRVMEERDSALHYIELGLDLSADMNVIEELYSLKGAVLMSLDRYEEAETSLYWAAQSPEVSMETMKNLATVLVENEKLDEAAIVLKETIDIFGDNLESLINTGYVCNQIGIYDESIFYLDEALKLEPENPYALANASLAYLRTGQLNVAFTMIEKSLKNDNTNSFAYRVRGECLLTMGENDRACKDFKKAIQMGYTVLHEQTEITKLMVESCNNGRVY